MCGLICDTSVAVFEKSAIPVKINVYDKILFQNQKKRKYGNQRTVYVNLYL